MAGRYEFDEQLAQTARSKIDSAAQVATEKKNIVFQEIDEKINAMSGGALKGELATVVSNAAKSMFDEGFTNLLNEFKSWDGTAEILNREAANLVDNTTQTYTV